jgi:dihydropteroate synthase
VSIDTMRTAVAEQAIMAGARVVNDVSGGKADSGMLRLVAESGVAYVCMHWRGHSEDMQSRASYDDVALEVIAELASQLEDADRAGVAPDKVIIDPGFGFAKTGEHNWQLLQRLDEFDVLRRPMLVGVFSQDISWSAARRCRRKPTTSQAAGRRHYGPDDGARATRGVGRPSPLGAREPGCHRRRATIAEDAELIRVMPHLTPTTRRSRRDAG